MPGRLMPTGVIDFGDVVRSWLVADLATAITSLLVRTAALAAARRAAPWSPASTRSPPLTEAEIAALWPLVAARATVLAVSVDDILAADPGNDYAREEQPLDWLILDRAASVPFPLAEVGAAPGGRPGRRPTARRRCAGWRPDRSRSSTCPPDAPWIDFSVTSTLFPDGQPGPIRRPPAAALEAALVDGYGGRRERGSAAVRRDRQCGRDAERAPGRRRVRAGRDPGPGTRRRRRSCRRPMTSCRAAGRRRSTSRWPSSTPTVASARRSPPARWSARCSRRRRTIPAAAAPARPADPGRRAGGGGRRAVARRGLAGGVRGRVGAARA